MTSDAANPALSTASRGAGDPPSVLRRLAGAALRLAFAYVLLLAVSAYLGQWTPDYLQGRDLWHFTVSRMVVPLVMLGVLAAVIRLVPAAILLAALLLFIGTISAIKREATGEPFQVSDLFLAGQSMHLLGYVGPGRWLAGATLVPAAAYALLSLRFRLWSLPLLVVCAGLLSTYRFEPVVKLIHKHSYWIGVENLTFSQAESERMNGLATHLYFSTAGLRLTTYSPQEVAQAMNGLDAGPTPVAAAGPAPDIYIVLGEAWWRDPSDRESPIDSLVKAGFAEATGISPVYGGTTPNAEFEVLTSVPVKSFQAGIIPFQHYVRYFSEGARVLPRLLAEHGYRARAYHNFTRRFWLRDQVYPRFGFARFDSMDDMTLAMQANGWPTDDGLFARVLAQPSGTAPEFHYIVTVATHGPFKEDKARDVIAGERHPGMSDYRDRLAAAAAALLKFEAALRARGRPYVIVVFGDHLPGTRLHQWKLGMKTETDPRLHRVPLLVAGNAIDAAALGRDLDGRPLFCIGPVLVARLGLGIDDRYYRHVARRCAGNDAADFLPSGQVIQNQLFTSAASQ